MKTNKIFMLAIAAGAMFLSSCSNDDELKQIEESAEPATMVFTATMENAGDATRTVLGGDSCTDVYWSKDTITIFNSAKTEGAKFTTSADGTASCTFSGEIETTTPYYAVYPAQTGATLSGTAINGVTLPANQTAVAGSYDPAAALMVATSSTTDLPFKNLNTLIKVTPKFDCTKIIFDAGTTQIAGKVNVTSDATNPTWNSTDIADADKKSTVTLTGIIQAGQTYYIAILPTTTTFTITLCAVESDNDGKLGFKKEKSTSYEFVRNKIVNLGQFDKTDAYKYDGQPQVNKPIVDFGLPSGVCWAKYNVGYESGKPYGDYFSWGYTEPLYNSYTFSSISSITGISWKSGMDAGYVWANYSYNTTGATTGEVSAGGGVGQPYTDGVLNDANDAATQKMETSANPAWHTPTMEEMAELRQNTVWVYESQEYGGVSSVNGYKVFRAIDDAHKGYIYMYDSRSGKTGNKWFKINTKNSTCVYNTGSGTATDIPDEVTDADTLATLNKAYLGKTAPLFLPSSGYFNGTTFNNGGGSGYYWSSTWYSATGARGLNFDSSYVGPQGSTSRYFGRTVRGVCE